MAQISNFNPNAIAVPNGNYFALPFSIDSARLVLIPMPWDVTTSYREGTALAPTQILEASAQVDLYDETFGNVWEQGISTDDELSEEILNLSRDTRPKASAVIATLEQGKDLSESPLQSKILEINHASRRVNDMLYRKAQQHLAAKKIVGVVGGDHSVPFGLIKAVREQHAELSILHFDAHADLRASYEGFHYSHASIFYNVVREIDISIPITQIGIRDFCEEEIDFAQQNSITCYTAKKINRQLSEGVLFQKICKDIINTLSNKVYISFDIDCLDPSLCPNTGTPVPGGLSYQQIDYFFDLLYLSGKQIVGFDLSEVGDCSELPSELDANIGARILYKLSLLALSSKK